MDSKFRIGDHVHLRGYAKGYGTGVVTDIEETKNRDGVSYIAVSVEYDKPIRRRWPYQNLSYNRGQHAEDRLELI